MKQPKSPTMTAPDDFPFFRALSGWEKKKENQWINRCPAHDDQNPSLQFSISDDGQKALVHCISAKCPTGEILQAAGCKFSDLYLAPPNQNGKPGSRSSKQKRNIVATYDYRDSQNILIYQVCRLEPKSFQQRRPNPEKPGEFIWNMQGIQKLLYRLPELIKAPVKQPVFIVGGEKDVETLRTWGFIATTNSGGEGKWLQTHNRYFKDRRIIIIPDNDEPGRKHAHYIASQLHGIAEFIRILELPDLPPKGDVTDWKNLDPSNNAEALKALAKAAPNWSPLNLTNSPSANPQSNEADEDPHRLAKLMIETRFTDKDGLRTLQFYRDSFYRYSDDHYIEIPSTKEFRAVVSRFIKAEFDRVNIAALANPSLQSIPQTKKVTYSLVTNVIEAIASYSHVPQRLTEHQPPFWLDNRYPPETTRSFIPLKNGILPLSLMVEDPDKEHPLIPHSPEFFSTICLPYSYDESADCPRWKEFLEYNLESDLERISFLQEWFGYNLMPDTSMQTFLALEGEGANGKSVICAALRALLGDQNVSAVPLEAFGIRFQLTPTLGKLANITGDTGELDKAAEGHLKAFTSGDRMMFDRKNLSALEAEPTARLTMAMNNRPRFSDKSGGLWRRMMILPMNVVISPDRRVRGMDKAKFWQESNELPGIFNWALEGLSRLLTRGEFVEPAISQQAKEDYRDETNPVREWLRDTFEESEQAEIKTTLVYSAYKKWCEAEGYRIMNHRTFGKELYRQFPKAAKVRKSLIGERYYVYQGLSFQPGTGSETTEHDDENWKLF